MAAASAYAASRARLLSIFARLSESDSLEGRSASPVTTPFLDLLVLYMSAPNFWLRIPPGPSDASTRSATSSVKLSRIAFPESPSRLCALSRLRSSLVSDTRVNISSSTAALASILCLVRSAAYESIPATVPMRISSGRPSISDMRCCTVSLLLARRNASLVCRSSWRRRERMSGSSSIAMGFILGGRYTPPPSLSSPPAAAAPPLCCFAKLEGRGLYCKRLSSSPSPAWAVAEAWSLPLRARLRSLSIW
mmetsp:Transcript_40480/g.114650  ORF Transcript_40480/g.114650 Transcript_40480/m.114650 type:complete len:250 (-) Transcript_40480:1005-1754(-)